MDLSISWITQPGHALGITAAWHWIGKGAAMLLLTVTRWHVHTGTRLTQQQMTPTAQQPAVLFQGTGICVVFQHQTVQRTTPALMDLQPGQTRTVTAQLVTSLVTGTFAAGLRCPAAY